MNADGSGQQRVSFGDGSYSTPVWSPRGDLIAFTKQSGGKFSIGVMKTDGSGETAPRPVIASAPTAGTWGQVVGVSMSTGEAVSRVTLVRFGGVTHAFSTEQRFEDLVFGQSGADLTVTLPTSPNVAPPGFYMLFAFDAAGVPSIAKVIRIS